MRAKQEASGWSASPRAWAHVPCAAFWQMQHLPSAVQCFWGGGGSRCWRVGRQLKRLGPDVHGWVVLRRLLTWPLYGAVRA